MRIPVTVEDDDGVGRLQIETQTSGSGAEQEDKVLGGRVVEGLQQRAAVLRFGGSCTAARIQHTKTVERVRRVHLENRPTLSRFSNPEELARPGSNHTVEVLFHLISWYQQLNDFYVFVRF